MKKKNPTNKYGAKKVERHGIKFDSKAEADYYDYLQTLPNVKTIELQPKFVLQPAFEKKGKRWLAINYVADFRVTYTDGTVEVIDVKGFETADFKLKKKMFEFQRAESLKLVTFSKIDGGWIESEALKKARKERKKLKESKKNGEK